MASLGRQVPVPDVPVLDAGVGIYLHLGWVGLGGGGLLGVKVVACGVPHVHQCNAQLYCLNAEWRAFGLYGVQLLV